MGTKEDLQRYPVFQYINGRLVKLRIPPSNYNVFEWQIHQYIEQQYIRLHPDKFKEIKHLQKLFFLPVRFIDKDDSEHNMHGELHSGCRSFKERYGIDREELLWKLKK